MCNTAALQVATYCIAAYGCVQRQLDFQLAAWTTGMMIGQHL